MTKIELTDDQTQFIHNNWWKMPIMDMAKRMNVSYSTVRVVVDSLVQSDVVKRNTVADASYSLPYAKMRVKDMLSRLQQYKTRDMRIYNEIEYMRAWLQYVEEIPVIEQGDAC